MNSTAVYAHEIGARQREEVPVGPFSSNSLSVCRPETVGLPSQIGEFPSPPSTLAQPASFQTFEEIPISEPGETVLLVSSNTTARSALLHFLEMEHFTVRVVGWGDPVLSLIDESVGMILADTIARNPQVDLMCKNIFDRFPHLPLVVLDDQAQEQEQRRHAFRFADAYLIKPCDRGEVLATIPRSLKNPRLITQNAQLKKRLGSPIFPVRLPTASPASMTLGKQIEAFGKIDSTILICGERGAGKNIVAQMIHLASSRAKEPFLVLPCNFLPQEIWETDFFGIVQNAFGEKTAERVGLLDVFSRGTILLDHIEYLTPYQQEKLYDFLQERMYRPIGALESRGSEARILASSRGNLPMVCAQRRFREDLFFKLTSMTITVPSLRERLEDLTLLAREIILRLARQYGANQPILSAGALNKLRLYSWPGNIQELESVLHRAMSTTHDTLITEANIVFDPVFSGGDLPDGSMGLAGLTLADIERRAIIETIHSCGGNRAKSAQKLGISEKTIYNKIKQYKLHGIV